MPRTRSPIPRSSAWQTCCAATTVPRRLRPGRLLLAPPSSGPLPHGPGQPQRRAPSQPGVPRRARGRADSTSTSPAPGAPPGTSPQRRAPWCPCRRGGNRRQPPRRRAGTSAHLPPGKRPAAGRAARHGRGSGSQPRLDLRDRDRRRRGRPPGFRRPLARSRSISGPGAPLVLAIPRRPARRSSLKDKGSSRTAGSDLGARPLATRPWGTVLYHGPGTSRKVYDLDLGSMERYPPPRLRKR